MLEFWEFLKKVWTFIKKFWWAIGMALAFLIGFLLKPYEESQDIQDLIKKREELKKKREELKKQQEGLKKVQEQLEKEAEEIEKKRYFNDPVDAAKYLNDELRKRK